MDSSDIIRGESLLELIKTLQTNKTLVKMEVAGRDVAQLTVITGLRDLKAPPLFKIDCPKEIRQTLSAMENIEMIFHFTGQDNLPYRFKSIPNDLNTEGIWIRYPRYIERKQKRKDFRIEVPYGSKLKGQFKELIYKLPIENLSRGGTIITDIRTRRASRKKPALKTGDELENIEIIFPWREGENNLHIRKATVVRVHQDTDQKVFQYGLQFSRITMEEEKLLIRAIYRIQRRFLRKRLPVPP